MSSERSARLLRLLKSEFSNHTPWLSKKTGAVVTVQPTGRGDSFTLVAVWSGNGRYGKFFNEDSVKTLGGHGGCAAKMAEEYISEVIEAKKAGLK
jgi:hypothetical protein